MKVCDCVDGALIGSVLQPPPAAWPTVTVGQVAGGGALLLYLHCGTRAEDTCITVWEKGKSSLVDHTINSVVGLGWALQN